MAMTDEYSRALCEERHKNVEEKVQVLFNKCDSIQACVVRKFNSIMVGIFSTLLTVIASLIVLVLRGKALY